MTPDLDELDELGKRTVAETEVLPPTMAWIKVRAGRLQRRRRATMALTALPMLLALGLVGWQVLQTDGGPQTIESVDQPETSNPEDVTRDERGDESGSGPGSQSQSQSDSESAEAMIVIPNVVGLSAEEAEAVLEVLGFGVEVVVERDSESVEAGQVIATEPTAGSVAAPGLTVTLMVQNQEPRSYSRYDDPDIQTEDFYPLLVDPSDLGPGWDQFQLSPIPEFVVFDPEGEEIPDDCRTVAPLTVRDGFYAEYGFGDSPDDAVVVFSRGDAEQLRSFYDGSLQLEDCYRPRVVERKPAPEIPGTTAVARYDTRNEQGWEAEVIIILHPEFVYSIEINKPEGAEPFDLDELAVRLVADYEAAKP